MIINFEQETETLTDIEMMACDLIIKGLKERIGREKAVTGNYIMKILKEKWNISLNAARFRKIINHIRLKNLVPCLMATSKGYYVSNDKEELSNYVQSLRQRCAAISMVADVIELQYKTA